MRIVYFAQVRESVGLQAEERQLPDGARTVADCVDWLASIGENYATALSDLSKIRFALDQQMVSQDASLEGASELAIFPPVTGG